MSANLITIKLSFSNVFAVRGSRVMVVDTGMPEEAEKILAALSQQAIRPKDVSLIFLTHGHLDHYGSAARLRELTGAPIALHRADLPYAREGKHPIYPTGIQGQMFAPYFRSKLPLPALEPDIIFDDDFDLGSFGIEGQVVATPGHSAGSVSVLLPNGDAIVGDLVRGGHLGGMFMPGRPEYPYYADDMKQLQKSLQMFMAFHPHRMYVGHGGPVSAGAVLSRFSSDIRFTQATGAAT